MIVRHFGCLVRGRPIAGQKAYNRKRPIERMCARPTSWINAGEQGLKHQRIGSDERDKHSPARRPWFHYTHRDAHQSQTTHNT
jgi:hypothetical protein